jgi:hypothetical protein
MRIKCNDGKVREFIPAEGVTRFVGNGKISKAYCDHCNKKFSSEPSEDQKEEWRKHDCELERTHRYVTRR